jgi:hypothetical protein
MLSEYEVSVGSLWLSRRYSEAGDSCDGTTTFDRASMFRTSSKGEPVEEWDDPKVYLLRFLALGLPSLSELGRTETCIERAYTHSR